MCGILGAVSNSALNYDIRAGLSEIRYRGPDHTLILNEGNVTLGHNRLSIIDLDSRSNQPFQSHDNRFTIIYNGEIYNFREIRRLLITHGFTFRTQSDTEVIVASYQKWGLECLIKFHGMFAFALLDNVKKEIILARDRFGEKPLFYSLKHGDLIFSSELRVFKNLIQGLKMDFNSVLDFLHFGFIPAPKTIYEDVFKVLPGSFMRYSLEEKRITSAAQYYSLSFSGIHSRLNAQQKTEMFEGIGASVASEISIADVSLGAFLSGGVDSGGSVYFLKNANSTIQTFTAGFDHEEFDESGYASDAANHLGVGNINKRISEADFIKDYNSMIRHYAEPHNDFSFIPTYLICKEAAPYHKVMISGDGADELFCGYPRYHKLKLFSAAQKLRPLLSSVATLAKFLPHHSNVRRHLHFIGSNPVDFYLAIMSMNFQPHEILQIAGPLLLQHFKHYTPYELIDKLLKDCSHSSPLEKLRYLDIKLTLADDMLVKVDRASMANSMEVRPFYLHPLMADFALNLSIDDLVTLKQDKFFLKRFFSTRLPPQNVFRRKMGFVFPLKNLISGSLKPFFNDCINHLPAELINKKQINAILSMHLKGNRNFTPQLNSLMTLGLWIKSNG